MSKHTQGAIRAAEAITGGKYGDKATYATSWGRKTVEGIADLIDCETAAADLLDALATALPFVEEAESDTAYKRGVVAGVVAKIRRLIERGQP